MPPEVSVLFKGATIARLTKTVLVFWNNGTDVLDQNRIVAGDPITISFDEEDRILGYRVLATTRDANGFSIVQDNICPHKLLIDFSYLDPGDGASVELLHDSKRRYPDVAGSIKGLPKGFDDLGVISANCAPSSKKSSLLAVVRNSRTLAWVAVVISLLFATFGFLPPEIRAAVEVESGTEARVFWPSVVAGLLYAIVPGWWLWVRRKRHPRSLTVA